MQHITVIVLIVFYLFFVRFRVADDVAFRAHMVKRCGEVFEGRPALHPAWWPA